MKRGPMEMNTFILYRIAAVSTEPLKPCQIVFQGFSMACFRMFIVRSVA